MNTRGIGGEDHSLCHDFEHDVTLFSHCLFFSVWTIDLACLLTHYSVKNDYVTVTLGVDKEYSKKARNFSLQVYWYF